MSQLKRNNWIGVAVESSPGVPVTPADYIPFKELSIKEMHEPQEDVSGAGIRDQQSQNSVEGKKWGAGQLQVNLEPTLVGYLFGAALGTFGSPSDQGSGVFRHTFSRLNNNTPKTLSLTHDRGIDRILCTNSAINSLQIGFGEGEMGNVNAEVVGKFPVTTASGTLATTSGTVFTFKDAQLQISDTLTNAANQVATGILDFNITINNNVERIYKSGNNDVSSIVQNSFMVEGEVSFLYENTTQRDLFKNLTKRAMILTLTGNGIGGGLNEFIKINLAKVRVIEWSPEGGLDDVLRERLSFVCEYSQDDSKTMDIVVQNRKSSYTS